MADMTRELDALVAEKVMGHKDLVQIAGEPHLTVGDGHYLDAICPDYSTSIADAWMVVEKIGLWYADNDLAEGIMWTFKIPSDEGGFFIYSAEAPTAPEAICQAALKAVEYEDIRNSS